MQAPPKARKASVIQVVQKSEEVSDEDPNQKQTRPGMQCLYNTLMSVFKSHPLPCIMGFLFFLILIGTSSYLYMEQQYKANRVYKKQVAMSKGWFKSNFKDINKISRDIQRVIEKDNPDLAEKQREHDKNLESVSQQSLPLKGGKRSRKDAGGEEAKE
mmetsp:Transcript_19361/g.28903  ORF Transcript_19361/g.28903 Transcript_19361/m.28903 type:complete len:158 (-) Transcript_19361:87-560(-)